MQGRIFTPIESFTTDNHSRYTAGVTLVREGHPILKQYGHMFQEVQPTKGFEWPEVEQATSAPGEVRRGPGRPRKEHTNA